MRSVNLDFEIETGCNKTDCAQGTQVPDGWCVHGVNAREGLGQRHAAAVVEHLASYIFTNLHNTKDPLSLRT
jgi:hypothetical protein